MRDEFDAVEFTWIYKNGITVFSTIASWQWMRRKDNVGSITKLIQLILLFCHLGGVCMEKIINLSVMVKVFFVLWISRLSKLTNSFILRIFFVWRRLFFSITHISKYEISSFSLILANISNYFIFSKVVKIFWFYWVEANNASLTTCGSNG